MSVEAAMRNNRSPAGTTQPDTRPRLCAETRPGEVQAKNRAVMEPPKKPPHPPTALLNSPLTYTTYYDTFVAYFSFFNL
ncbi:hypothetical protein E2C01_075707 [Portunus trituberculatus]|uniref:Uncharacterized protein n=1 Tax=Portunus trituberculatus TaxID=210409 RepID=A0A5B7IGH1_PORTR|nr:hypothetical protein [Portunus trituberculatus]